MDLAGHLRCSLCGEVRERVAKSGNVVVCDDCAALCLEILADGAAGGGITGVTTSVGTGEAATEVACSACGARGAEKYLAGMADVHVCSDCMRVAGRTLGVSAADGPRHRDLSELDEDEEVSRLVAKVPPKNR